jgi:DNA polymerase-3 subunit gamma/tau
VSYQVLARKWRPQTFEEVVGQQGVTQTLRNAISGGRIGQSFIFAGARGVGKTTTARILAKALNCVEGPTVSPCGRCDACREIAEGRDMDVLEIDAATHTQVDKVREIIIENLSLRPVRDRYKIFIIDEVHMLSNSSFNALLKSVEEPPPHVVFMMATTELHKIPDTIRSRSQEFEFRAIGTRAIAEQLATIAVAEGLEVEPAALQLLARQAEGSLRDAESAFDQVIAFAGTRIAAADVATVLGLVGHDFLLDVLEVVAAEDAARVFDVSGRAVEAGLDLRLVCRELSRALRDLMVLAIDPARASEPEFAPEGDAARLAALAGRFSREDLLRAFDVLSRAEFEIRTAPQPRYHFEMALLKLIYARRMVPIAALMDQAGARGAAAPAPGQPAGARPAAPVAATARAATPPAGAAPRSMEQLQAQLAARKAAAAPPPAALPEAPPATAAPPAAAAPPAPAAPPAAPARSPDRPAAAPPSPAPPAAPRGPRAPLSPDLVAAFLERVRVEKKLLHGTFLSKAQRVEPAEGAIVLTFAPEDKAARAAVERARVELEAMAAQVAGGTVALRCVEGASTRPAAPTAGDLAREQLRRQALEHPAVQATLEVFAAEIRDVEEIT